VGTAHAVNLGLQRNRARGALVGASEVVELGLRQRGTQRVAIDARVLAVLGGVVAVFGRARAICGSALKSGVAGAGLFQRGGPIACVSGEIACF
jgi:hypothetical protein